MIKISGMLQIYFPKLINGVAYLSYVKFDINSGTQKGAGYLVSTQHIELNQVMAVTPSSPPYF
jgi:hypothetical protein